MGYDVFWAGKLYIHGSVTSNIRKFFADYSPSNKWHLGHGDHPYLYTSRWPFDVEVMYDSLSSIIENLLEPQGVDLNGVVYWEGDAKGDVGKMVVMDNDIHVYHGRIIYFDDMGNPEPYHKKNHKKNL